MELCEPLKDPDIELVGSHGLRCRMYHLNFVSHTWIHGIDLGLVVYELVGSVDC